MEFSGLGLSKPFLQATEELGYKTATPIQAAAIPVVLAGRDLIGCAQTGTGKTAAFTLPTLDRLMQTRPAKHDKPAPKRRGPKGSRPKPRAIRALVLSPTRELAAQIGESLNKYGKFTPLRQTVVFGGVSQHHQVKALRHGVDALVATPGRLLDLKDQGYIDLSNIEILVFDEADQMLDMGFLPALKRIVAAVPRERQTLMFSATMPDEIRSLAQQWLSNPQAIEVAPVSTPAERITQSVHLVDKKKKPDLLAHFLKSTPRGRTLVFSRTKHGADKIVRKLSKDHIRAAAIHGNKSQGARNRALAQFKSKNPPVLVATDIAARGLDISDVSHVVNFDLPETPETYVHRIGRTARAGAEGCAVSFCAGDERGLLRQIERLINTALEVEPTVEGFEPTEPIKHGGPNRRRGGGGGNRGGKFGRKTAGAANGKAKSKGKRFGSGGKPNGGKAGTKSAGGKSAGGRRKGDVPDSNRKKSSSTSEKAGSKPAAAARSTSAKPTGNKPTGSKPTSATGRTGKKRHRRPSNRP